MLPAGMGIDDRIRKRFKLFYGLRSGEEDNRIYQLVTARLAEEILCFAQENISIVRAKKLLTEPEIDRKLWEAIKEIPRVEMRLPARLAVVVDNLAFETMQVKRGQDGK